jgi:hypothetical protein
MAQPESYLPAAGITLSTEVLDRIDTGRGVLRHHHPAGHPPRHLHSVADLEAAIGIYIDAWNQRCQPFTWTKDADTILAKATPPKNRNTTTSSETRH